MISTFQRTMLCVLAGIVMGAHAQGDRERIGVGYDEGLAARFFITDRIGVQAGIGFEHLGGYDQTANNGARRIPETDFSVAVGGIFSIVSGDWVYLDAILQGAVAHDDSPDDPAEVGDRNEYFIRAALAPEILLNGRLGLGMRLGIETAIIGESKENAPAGGTRETDDGRTNFRFYGPENPFDGALLGLSVYYYFGGPPY
jgi:hypothetical protein